MKKICCGLILLSVAYSNISSSVSKSKTIEISEKCYQNWQKISEDAAMLKYYMQAACNSIGEVGKVDVKPSVYLQWLRDESDVNNTTQLKFMPVTSYLHSFITDENYVEFDKAFTLKYNETQNVQETWNWFHGHFTQHMKTALENYSKDMIERDAAKVTLAEQGVHFKDNGKTIIFDGNRMSEDSEDMEKVREALDRLYKE